MALFRSVLVATDLGEHSRRALDLGVELAETLGAKLTVVHVFEIPVYAYGAVATATVDLFTPIEAAAKDGLGKVMDEVRRKVPNAAAVLRQGTAWREVLAVAESERSDLVITGTHGRKGLQHFVLGSVAEKIVRLSPVPVMTVRGGAAG